MNANDLFKAVMEIDLTPIKTKLMHVASGEGWSQEKANAVEKEYRRFLCLMKLFPEEDTAPLVDVDTFWHYHILDTMKYAADCEQVFGYFLHHYPHIGLGDSAAEDQARFESGDRMRELYEATFGEAYAGWETGSIEASAPGADPNDASLNAHATDKASAIAFSAGPSRDKLNSYASGKASAIAFSAGPSRDKLNAHASGKASAIAFSAGPSRDKLNAHASGKAGISDYRKGSAASELATPTQPTMN
jgi:hypothetical protein